MKSEDGRFVYLTRDGQELPEDAPHSAVGEMEFFCKRSGRMCGGIAIRQKTLPDIPLRTWTLAGTKDKPTLTSSVNCEGCWHGWITNGVMMDQANGVPDLEMA